MGHSSNIQFGVELRRQDRADHTGKLAIIHPPNRAHTLAISIR